MKIQIKVLNKEFYKKEKLGGEYYDLPSYQTFGSAAMDLCCTEDITIYPGETRLISTGLAIWIGSDKWGHTDICTMGVIVPRSGLGTRGLILANTIGVIDEDYQGELKLSAWNRHTPNEETTLHKIILNAGDRIAQLIFVPIIRAQWGIVDDFESKTNRGDGGFGSTGTA